jgi:hypothetical protein
LNCFVHIDGEGLGEVSAVVVLTVSGRQPLHMIIGNVTPPPQKSGKSDVVLGSGRPNWFNLILNNENVTLGIVKTSTKDQWGVAEQNAYLGYTHKPKYLRDVLEFLHNLNPPTLLIDSPTFCHHFI